MPRSKFDLHLSLDYEEMTIIDQIHYDQGNSTRAGIVRMLIRAGASALYPELMNRILGTGDPSAHIGAPKREEPSLLNQPMKGIRLATPKMYEELAREEANKDKDNPNPNTEPVSSPGLRKKEVTFDDIMKLVNTKPEDKEV